MRLWPEAERNLRLLYNTNPYLNQAKRDGDGEEKGCLHGKSTFQISKLIPWEEPMKLLLHMTNLPDIKAGAILSYSSHPLPLTWIRMQWLCFEIV